MAEPNRFIMLKTKYCMNIYVLEAPSVPVGLHAAVDGMRSLTLSWAHGNVPADHYIIQYYLNDHITGKFRPCTGFLVNSYS